MKKLYISLCLVAMMCAAAPSTIAQVENKENSDSVAMANLKQKQTQLQREIKTQDAKRNKQLAGMGYEDIEDMNDTQDSICLDLRSQLVDVNLQMEELRPALVNSAIKNHFKKAKQKVQQTTDSVAPAPTPKPKK